MERKTLNYELRYRDSGKDKKRVIKIDFIPNGVIEDYDLIENATARARMCVHQLRVNGSVIAVRQAEGKDLSDVIEENRRIAEEIRTIGTKEFFNNRFELLRRILIINGVSDKDEITRREFWNDCVDVSDLLDFLKCAVTKDITESKKKTN